MKPTVGGVAIRSPGIANSRIEEDVRLLKCDVDSGAFVWAVTEGETGGPDTVFHGAPGTDTGWHRTHGAFVEVRAVDENVDAVPCLHRQRLVALAGQVERLGGPATGRADDRFDTKNLVEHREPPVLVPRPIVRQQCLVCERMPGGGADELTGGDHARRREGEAFPQDLLVRAALVDQMGDEIVAALTAPGPHGGPY